MSPPNIIRKLSFVSTKTSFDGIKFRSIWRYCENLVDLFFHEPFSQTGNVWSLKKLLWMDVKIKQALS